MALNSLLSRQILSHVGPFNLYWVLVVGYIEVQDLAKESPSLLCTPHNHITSHRSCVSSEV